MDVCSGCGKQAKGKELELLTHMVNDDGSVTVVLCIRCLKNNNAKWVAARQREGNKKGHIL